MRREGYLKTGVMIVDKVGECIYYHEKVGTPVSCITLNKMNWGIFENFANMYFEGSVNEDKTVEWDGVTVRKGSDLMVKDMTWEYKKAIEA